MYLHGRIYQYCEKECVITLYASDRIIHGTCFMSMCVCVCMSGCILGCAFVRESDCPLCLASSGKSGVCGGEDRGAADGERPTAQCRRPCGHRVGRGARQDCLPWEVCPVQLASC